MIYFDNAASTYKKPPEVTKALKKAITEYAANPGRSQHDLSVKAAEAVYSCREKLAQMYNTQPEYAIFTCNATQAINIVLKGYLKSGDEVITSDMEHNAILRPLKAVEKSGVKTQAAVVLPDDNKTVENFKNLINEKTQLIAITGASNVTGKILPVAQLGELCRSNNIKLLIDGAQSGGYVDYNMQRDNIDFLCLAGHKGLYGPQGAGALLLKENTGLATIVEGGTGTDSKNTIQPEELPERLESGTLCLPCIMGFHAGLDFITGGGFKEKLAMEQELLLYAYKELKKIGAVLYTDLPDNGYVPVLSFNIKNLPSTETGGILSDNGIYVRSGFHCNGAAHKKLMTDEIGTVRISFSVYNKKSEIDRMIKVLKNI